MARDNHDHNHICVMGFCELAELLMLHQSRQVIVDTGPFDVSLSAMANHVPNH